MTGNSRYEEEHIAEFAQLVAERGGDLLDHAFIRRGRFLWQKGPERVLAEARARLEDRTDLWPEGARIERRESGP